MTNNTLYDFPSTAHLLLSWKRYHKFCACFRPGANHQLLPKFTDMFCLLHAMMRLLVLRDFPHPTKSSQSLGPLSHLSSLKIKHFIFPSSSVHALNRPPQL
jgi:hypothetical protein